MIALLLDQGLPARAARYVRDRGWDTVHVEELGMWSSRDAEFLDFGAAEGRVVVTLDRDFPALLALGDRVSPSVLLLRLQGLDTDATVHLIEDTVPLVRDDLIQGAVVVHTGDEVRIRRLPIAGSG